MADNNNIERVIQLSTRITELRRQLEASEAELQKLVVGSNEPPAPPAIDHLPPE